MLKKRAKKEAVARNNEVATERDDSLIEYRAHLVDALQEAQADFDKTVLTLSGGSLAVSITFVKDIVGPGAILNKGLLMGAWACWVTSVTLVLISYFFSQVTIRRMIRQVDSNSIHSERPGGLFSRVTAFLNGSGAVLFLIGVLLIALFVWQNLEVGNGR